MKIRLKIDGVDRTGILLERDWEIQGNAFGVLDTADFLLDDPSKTLSVARGKDVVIEDFNDVNTRFFGGVITDVQDYVFGIGRRFRCKALDWTFVLDGAVASETYRGKSDQYIISEAVAIPKGLFRAPTTDTVLTDFDISTNVKQGIANTQYLQFKRQSIRDAMDVLADMSGFIWYVDPFKRIHYKASGTDGHTFSLSDAPNDVISFGYQNLQRHRAMSHLVNAVLVEGAFVRELLANIAEIERTYQGDGVITRWNLGYLWQAATGNARVKVFRNTGTDATPTWADQTVGLAGKDTTTSHNVVWDPVARVLEWNTAPPNLNKSFRIDGDRLRGLVHEAVDQASIEAFGRQYTLAVKDVTLLSDEQVYFRAEGELKKLKAESEWLTLRTTKDSISHGKAIRLVNTILGIDKDYLVEKVVTRLLGSTVADYSLTLKPI